MYLGINIVRLTKLANTILLELKLLIITESLENVVFAKSFKNAINLILF
jgi:hypothetical protein